MSENLLELLPKIKRARDYYLYDEKGNRYLDLYLDGGRALCGHRPNGLSNTLKNAVSRGIYAPYPSVYGERLFKVLRKGFPRYSRIGMYRSAESFENAFSGEALFADPALGGEKERAVRWRPYIPLSDGNELVKVVFPFPGIDAIAVLSDREELPPSDPISPLLQAGLVRSWFDLQNRLEMGNDTNWTMLDRTGDWNRRGPYLEPRCKAAEYPELFRRYLGAGILLSPEYGEPSICAVEIREGSLKKLFKEKV